MGKKRKGSRAGKQTRKKRGVLVGALILTFVIGFFAWGRVGTKAPSRLSHTKPRATSGYVRLEARVPLSPALFVGKTAVAYGVAHEIPEVLDQLYCYCYCDKSLGHLNLLSCFIDSHAAT